jgi:hypothetical protein
MVEWSGTMYEMPDVEMSAITKFPVPTGCDP